MQETSKEFGNKEYHETEVLHDAALLKAEQNLNVPEESFSADERKIISEFDTHRDTKLVDITNALEEIEKDEAKIVHEIHELGGIPGKQVGQLLNDTDQTELNKLQTLYDSNQTEKRSLEQEKFYYEGNQEN